MRLHLKILCRIKALPLADTDRYLDIIRYISPTQDMKSYGLLLSSYLSLFQSTIINLVS